MRKSAVILLPLLLIMLVGCKPNNDNNLSFIEDTSMNTKEDILSSVSDIIHALEFEDMQQNDMEYDEIVYPVELSDIKEYNPPLPFSDTTGIDKVYLSEILSYIYENLNIIDRYVEGTWTEVYNDQDQKISEYSVFIDNTEVVLQYYQFLENSIIEGTYFVFSNKTNEFQYTYKTVFYDTVTDSFKNAKEVSYKQYDSYYEKKLTINHDNLKEKEYTFIQLDTSDYFKFTETQTNDTSIYYSADEHLYMERNRVNTKIESINMIQYSENNEIVFMANNLFKSPSFEFNVKYVYGWDKILKIDNQLHMFDSANRFMKLPEEIEVLEKESFGIFLVSEESNTTATIFNLVDTQLYPPIYLDEALDYSKEIANQIDMTYQSEFQETLESIDNLNTELLEFVHTDVFYGMARELN